MYVYLIFRRYEVSTEDCKIDGKEWYHYFLCGYKVPHSNRTVHSLYILDFVDLVHRSLNKEIPNGFRIKIA